MSRKRWASVKLIKKYATQHVRLWTKCTVNSLQHLWFIRRDVFFFSWKSSIWLPTANLPECSAGAGHRRWRMRWAKVFRPPLWSVLWPRGRGGAPNEDQQLPVLLSPTKDRQTHLVCEQAMGELDQPWYRRPVGSTGQLQLFLFFFLVVFVCPSSFHVCPPDRQAAAEQTCDLLLCRAWQRFATQQNMDPQKGHTRRQITQASKAALLQISLVLTVYITSLLRFV